jgi:cytochrome c553
MKKLMIALAAAVVSFNAAAGGNVANGEALVKKYSCAACHGADFNKPVDPSYPKLAGQHPDYLAHALTARLGQHDAHHQIMECLGEMIWNSQRNGVPPDADAYIECVRKRAAR